MYQLLNSLELNNLKYRLLLIKSYVGRKLDHLEIMLKSDKTAD